MQTKYSTRVRRRPPARYGAHFSFRGPQILKERVRELVERENYDEADAQRIALEAGLDVLERESAESKKAA